MFKKEWDRKGFSWGASKVISSFHFEKEEAEALLGAGPGPLTLRGALQTPPWGVGEYAGKQALPCL